MGKLPISKTRKIQFKKRKKKKISFIHFRAKYHQYSRKMNYKDNNHKPSSLHPRNERWLNMESSINIIHINKSCDSSPQIQSSGWSILMSTGANNITHYDQKGTGLAEENLQTSIVNILFIGEMVNSLWDEEQARMQILCYSTLNWRSW